MIKKWIKKLLSKFGIEVRRIQPEFKQVKTSPSAEKPRTERPAITKLDDPSQHFELAKWAYETHHYFFAYAEMKTASFLGLDAKLSEEWLNKITNKLPDLRDHNHNQYYRLKSLANAVIESTSLESDSILDVGGGIGMLASFIQNRRYVLAEPTTNGLNGLSLPFDDGAFDLVVSCHVLEHIPFTDREIFLDELLAKAKKGIILLNPIHVDVTFPAERMDLIIDVTDAAWAKEHRDCSLPKVEWVQQYATERDLKFEYRPNGAMATTLALVFFDFLSKNMPPQDVVKINRFFNEKLFDYLDSNEAPNAGLFLIMK